MGDLSTVFGIVTLVLMAISALFFFQMRTAQKRSDALADGKKNDERALLDARKELSDNKEKLTRKDQMLRELKEEAKKKAKRQGKKEARKTQGEKSQPESADVGELRDQLKQQKQVIAGLQQQVKQVQKEAEQTVQGATKIAKEEVGSSLTDAKTRADKAETELKELRLSVKKQREARPDVPGSGLDLKALEPAVVQELAKYYRASEEYRKLYAVAGGQLQLERDKVADAQRRYLAVCRELAVAASTDGVDDARAKELAEAVVAQSDAAQARPRPARNHGGGETGNGEGKKKRRRRRRRGPRADGDQNDTEAKLNNVPADDTASSAKVVASAVAADAIATASEASPASSTAEG